MDTTVVWFTLGLSLVAGLLFGAMPALHATSVVDLVKRIREGGGNSTGDPGRQRLRSTLIVAEITLAVVLLVAAGLLMRSFGQLLAVDLGFSTSGVQTFTLTLPSARYTEPEQRAAFVDSLLSRVSAPEGVEAAAIFGLPLTGFRYGMSTSVRDGVRLADDEQDRLTLQVRVVTSARCASRSSAAGRSPRQIGGDPKPSLWAGGASENRSSVDPETLLMLPIVLSARDEGQHA